ncbi:MAG TPA: carboxypeptidase-like regulatory domain-containing protein, partial [Bryobacteraceae bacterium]|nr:carboxypeptidase-like regulatory domain-containing protein [Bryobacteraceae bacterium]
MRKATLLLAVCVVLGLPGGANLAWGQGSRATLGGRVMDGQGAVVPNATVVVTSDETGVKQTTKTNGQGNWTVQFLVPGTYSFSVVSSGFRQLDRQGITLQTGDNKQMDTQLDLGTSTT